MTDEPEVYERGNGCNPVVDAAAWLILGPGLRGEPSPILTTASTWTAANAREFYARIKAADRSSRSFGDKLADQLRGAPDAVISLAAELIYLQVLPLTSVTAGTKRNRVESVLSWAEQPLRLSDQLREGLDAGGVFGGGAGFNIRVWQHLLWLCQFIEHWWEVTADRRARALADPWAFRDLAAEVPGNEGAIRLTLDMLVWPAYFDDTVSEKDRRRIRDAFAHRIGGHAGDKHTDVDQDLWRIRGTLQAPGEPWVSWYEEPYASEWRRPASDTAGATGRHAWLVRPGRGGVASVSDWLEGGFVSLPASNLHLDLDNADEQAVRDAVDIGYAHLDYAQRLLLNRADRSFILRMAPDDLVLVVAGEEAHLGAISDDPQLVEVEGSRLRRDVAWLPSAILKSSLPEPIPALLDKQGDVVDLTSALGVLQSLEDSLTDTAQDPADRTPAPVQTGSAVPSLPAASADLAASVYIDRGILQEYLDLLAARQQLVFYGPPGTGKTYLAEKLGAHIVGGDTSRLRTVQFHPSYAYEDFFEGLRPVVSDGQVTYQLVPGPLRRLVAEATTPGNESLAYVLVIDEMNRANLAKVFGELYYLLEYRDHSITLQYGGPDSDDFRLPKNLFIIGTMNTLDRSIAMVDAAIRRRFPFVELHPAVEPVASVLPNYLAAQHADSLRARLLSELNEGIDERDLQLGPSYLMKDAATSQSGLERIWRYDILPLLDDHFYGARTPERIREQFGLDALLARVGGIGPVDVSGMAGAVELDHGREARAESTKAEAVDAGAVEPPISDRVVQ